ncbi:MAG: enoyl-ACP reductase [Anaerolineae bacterium]|nr:enoyl-ACP reductase [Anaerolineae bacterium]
MGLLEGKVALVFGVANKNSIAWGITQAFHREGATLGLSYAGEALERRVVPLAETLGVDFVVQCNVNSDEELDATFAKIKERFGRVDVLVHSIAYATREDLDGLFVDTSRQGFITALETSAYSLVALSKRAAPLMVEGGSIMALSYYGAEKVLPHYNVMGVAKSALESSVRYLAADLGPKKIRVNAISAGPIKTLSAAGIAGFRKMYRLAEDVAPLRELVSQDDVGDVAAWLGSHLARMVTGETIYVDAGLSILGMPMTEEDL